MSLLDRLSRLQVLTESMRRPYLGVASAGDRNRMNRIQTKKYEKRLIKVIRVSGKEKDVIDNRVVRKMLRERLQYDFSGRGVEDVAYIIGMTALLYGLTRSYVKEWLHSTWNSLWKKEIGPDLEVYMDSVYDALMYAYDESYVQLGWPPLD